MYDEIILPLGHHEILQRVEDFDVGLMEEVGPLVRLVASVEVRPEIPPGPGRHRGATTLAIRIDPKAAIELAEQIRVLARTMGWRLPREDGNPA
jgi:hypothetical protein